MTGAKIEGQTSTSKLGTFVCSSTANSEQSDQGQYCGKKLVWSQTDNWEVAKLNYGEQLLKLGFQGFQNTNLVKKNQENTKFYNFYKKLTKVLLFQYVLK